MKYTDVLYGEFEIDDVLESLFKSDAMQRLAGVHQAGAAYLVQKNWTVNRLEHSVGVMLLVKKFGAKLDEQIAALLHDISHTSFSHVVDYLMQDKEEGYHDSIFLETLEKNGITAMVDVESLGLDDLTRYTLLEQPSPLLCADRIDYFLRDMLVYGHVSRCEVDAFLEALCVIDGRFAITSEEMALWYIRNYERYVSFVLLEPKNVYSAWKMSEILRYAMQKHYIELDLLKQSTDNNIIAHLQGIHDTHLQRELATLHPDIAVEINNQTYDFYMTGKTRVVDPLVLTERGVVPISTINKEAQESIQFLEKQFEIGSFIRQIHV
ncbi:HD domain-containing protein [Listeria booriae]|uniref:HD domain-containing protein n=1 Tax=Listeria booriae TaxID=1552123 RepID=UPI00163D4AD0|nr:HD domain-containing protein [Listeria booriae]MBC1306766.1 HD domain-containing protein [Listeria booriae]